MTMQPTPHKEKMCDGDRQNNWCRTHDRMLVSCHPEKEKRKDAGEDAEVSKYDGNKRCYFGVWLLDKVTELHIALEEKFSDQKKGSVVAAYIEQEATAILKEVDALLDHAKAEERQEVVDRIQDVSNNHVPLSASWSAVEEMRRLCINAALSLARKEEGN